MATIDRTRRALLASGGAAAFFLLQIQILPLRPAWHAFCSLIASMIASIGLPQPSLPISGHKPPTGEINGSW